MELKDVILSTLAEMEESNESEPSEVPKVNSTPEQFFQEKKETQIEETLSSNELDGELVYLNSIKERLLVLFEGFQAPNNSNIEAKVDMTLNFLEYTLATIDARVQKLEKGVSL